MKKTILNLIIIFSSCIFFGQKNDQKLLDKIANYKKQDTIKVEMIVDYCIASTFSNNNIVLDLALQGLAISNKIKYQLGIIRSLNCIGNYYYQQAKYEKAVEVYNKALAISENTNDVKNIIIGKSNLASLYTRIHQEQKALSLFKEADSLLVATKQSESQNRAAILTNIGMAYSSLKQHKKSIEYHKKTLAICVKKNIVFGIALAKSNIGEEYIRLKQFENAFAFLESSKKISEAEGYDNFLSQIYKNLAEINLSKNQNIDAIQNLEKAVAIAKKIEDQNALLGATLILQETYFKIKDYKNAYLQSTIYFELNESVNGNDKQKIISEVNTKYETEKKQAQIKELSQAKKISDLQNKQQKAGLILLGFVILSILISGYLLFKRYKTNKQNELLKLQLKEAAKTLDAEKKAAESELKALKSQMNPHFIFNALNGIQEQFMYGDKVLANKQMSNFTSLTRQILSISGKKTITLENEIDLLNKYLELEKMRFETDFEFTIKTSENVNVRNEEIPPMIIQPFVENAIKHGLLHKAGEKKLSIFFDISLDEDFLLCTIIDNGIGRTKSAEINAKNQSKHESFSTESISLRLDILQNTDNKEDLVYYEDVLNNDNEVIGTKVLVKIPIG